MSSNDARTPEVFLTEDFRAMNAEHDFDAMFEKLEVYVEFIREQEIVKAAEGDYDLEGMPTKQKAEILHDRAGKSLEVIGCYMTEDPEDGGWTRERGLRDVVTQIALVSSAYKRYSDAVGGDEGSKQSLDAMESAPFLGGLYISMPNTPQGETA